MALLREQVSLIFRYDSLLKSCDGALRSVRSILGLRSFSDNMPTLLPSLRSVAKFALGSAQVVLIQHESFVRGGAPLSCSNTQLSCHNTTAVADTCCFNSPGGQLLQTQFWDTSPSTGPTNHWTVHGLWYEVISKSYPETEG